MKNEHNHFLGETREESLALLNYMAHHNAHHAEELKDIGTLLSSDAAALVSEAVDLLNASTEKIKEALEKMEG